MSDDLLTAQSARATEDELLARLIVELRGELEAEIPRRLHQSSGEPAADWSTRTAPRTNGHGDGWTGLPFTGQFERYLGHSDHYGYEFIAAGSFDAIRDHCRTNHDPSHYTADDPASSLCRRMAVAVVEMRQPLAFVADREDIGLFAVRKLLLDVLRHAEAWRGRTRDKATARDEDAEPVSLDEMLRRQHNETREQKVWERMRRKHLDWRGEPLLAEWEVERARRLAQHRKLGCGECLDRAA